MGTAGAPVAGTVGSPAGRTGQDGPPGEATRSALRAAAAVAIAEEGWQAAGARSVARRAGVPLGAINYHFAGKEDLFRQAALAEIFAMFAAPGRIIAEAEDLEELVERMLAWSRADEVTATQQVLLLEVMAQSRRDPELGRLLAEGLGGYRRAVADAFARLAPADAAADDGGDDAVSDGGGDDADAPGGCSQWLALASAFAAHCDGLWLHFVVEPDFPNEPAGRQATAAWLARLTG